MGLENLEAKVSADISDFQRKFDEMRGQLNQLGRAVAGPAKEASNALKGVQEETAKIGTLLRGGALIAGGKAFTDAVTLPIIGLGKQMVGLASQMEQTEIAFTTMLGSAERAGAFLKELQQFAATTPFEFTDLTQAAKKMLALGFEAQQIIPTLTNVGNAVAGLGGNAALFDRIVLALGQMQAKGKVSAEEMKQLAEAGIPAWQAVATAIGVTVPEAMEQAKKGAIDAQTAIAALQADMATRFGGLMEAQSKTVVGLLSNLQDTVGFIMTGIGAEIIEALQLKEAIAVVGDFASSFLDWFKSLDAGTKQVLVVFTTVFAAGGPILVAVGAFMTALAAVTAPMLAAGAIIAGIVAGVTLILLNWQKIKDTGVAIWTSVKTAIVGTAEAIYTGIKTWLIDKAEAIAGRLQSVAQSFAKPFEWLADHLVGRSVIPDMVEDIDRQFRALDANTTSSVRNTVVTTARILEGGALTWQGAINQFVTLANNTWGNLAQTVGASIARMTDETVHWGEVVKQIGIQVLGQLIALGIQLTTQALITLATQTTAHQAMETAKTVATTAGETARAGIVLATNKVLAASTISTLAGIAAVGNAAVTVLGTVLAATSATLAAIGASLVATLVGAPLGAAFLAASAAVLAAGTPAVAAAFGAIQAAVGTAIATAAAGLAVPAFAEGGAVFGPTLALVGEHASRSNPEYIGHAAQLGLAGGPTTIVLELDGDVLARKTFTRLPGHVYRMGFR